MKKKLSSCLEILILLGTRGGNARLGILNAFTNCRFGKVRQVDLPCCRGWRPLGSW